MLKELRIKNFKSFGEATLKFGPLTTLIGTNASGKSNLLDALRFLHAVARGYTLAEIFGGKNAFGELVWDGIRGGPNGAIRFGEHSFRIEVAFDLSAKNPGYEYIIEVESNGKGPRVSHESLYVEGKMCFDSSLVEIPPEQADPKLISVKLPKGIKGFASNQPILCQIDGLPLPHQGTYGLTARIVSFGLKVRSFFGAFRFLDLDLKRMGLPSAPGSTDLNNSGDNLSSVLKSFDENAAFHGAFASWIRALTPMDVERIEFLDYPDGKVLALLVEHGGRKIPLSNASEGTLRFLGILAAIFSPEPPSLICFEEIETGFHPARLQLLLRLIAQETSQKRFQTWALDIIEDIEKAGELDLAAGDVKFQVLATTHSPGFVRLLTDHLDHAYLTYRVEGVPESRLKSLLEIPTLADVIKSQDIATLYETGWMENTLFFTEGTPEPIVLEDVAEK